MPRSCLPTPGIIFSSEPSEPILRICFSWSSRSSSVNSALRSFCSSSLAFFSSSVSSARSMRRDHVAHAEDAPGHAVGVELLELVELLADRQNLIGTPVTCSHRERRAAAGVAVELRHHDAVELDPLVERLGDVDGVLARHRVEHQQRVGGLDRVAIRTSSSISSSSTCRRPAVSTITTSRPCWRACRTPHCGDVDRVGVGALLVDRHADLLADGLQLVDGRRAVDVAGHQRRLACPAWPAAARACRWSSSCPSPAGRT